MAIDSIGSFTFTRLTGPIAAPGTVLQEILRPGEDGVAYKTMGVKAKPTKLESLCFVDSFATALTAITDFGNIQGSLVTIVKANQTFNNMIILDTLTEQPKLVFANGAYAVMLHTSWQVQYGGT